MIKLSYFDLISMSPYRINGVGSVRAITFRDIDNLPLKLETYKVFTSVLSFTKDTFIEYTKMSPEQVDLLNEQFKKYDLKPTVYDYILTNELIRNNLFLSLDFFFVENVGFDTKNGTFILYTDKENPDESKVGLVTRDNFKDVFSVILQRCSLYDDSEEDCDDMVFRDEATRRKWMKQRKGAKERKKSKDSLNLIKYDLGNIISAICAEGIGITTLNVWDMTVYNGYDQFQRIRNNRVDKLVSRSISIWGDKKGEYDFDNWLTNNVTDKNSVN